MGGSLVVNRGGSCSEGRGFESQHRILNGYFFHKLVVIFLTEILKINGKESRDNPF